MSTKIRIIGGSIEAVYDDRFMPLFKALGVPHIERATDVNYNDSTGNWHAWHRATCQIIASGPIRANVIAQEIAWLENFEENRNKT